VDPEPGSSGSPCLNTVLDLVALHHGGSDPSRGVRLAGVLDFLSAWKPELDAKGLGALVV
jgi:hypothetical protein